MRGDKLLPRDAAAGPANRPATAICAAGTLLGTDKKADDPPPLAALLAECSSATALAARPTRPQ
jgi:hypothetical protein